MLIFSLQRPSPCFNTNRIKIRPQLSYNSNCYKWKWLYTKKQKKVFINQSLRIWLPLPLLPGYRIKIPHLSITFKFSNIVNQKIKCIALVQFKKNQTYLLYHCTLLKLLLIILVNTTFQFSNNDIFSMLTNFLRYYFLL